MDLKESLPLMKGATRSFLLSEFKGSTVAIDAYSWFRQGVNEGLEIEQLPDFCLNYIELLHSQDIRPILIFDGRQLPMRQPNAKQRIYDEAYFKLKGLEIAAPLIKECHNKQIDCLVAPYEAAAQIAFFNLRGVAELVVSENPDLVLFGCSKICLKLDMEGYGLLLDSEKICEAVKLKSDMFEKFKHMCILSGCDYIEPLHGIGLNDAYKFINSIQETNPEIFLDAIPRVLEMPDVQITDEYKQNFMMADAIFRHQVIFNPFTRKLEHLFDPHIAGTNPTYCVNAGEIYDQEKAYQVALGNLHPCTMKRLDSWDPKAAGLTNRSIWCDGQYQRSPPRNQQKDSFKQYFSNYKFETINEIDADDSTQKTEENLAGKSSNIRLDQKCSSKTFGIGGPPVSPLETLAKYTYPTITHYPFVQPTPIVAVARTFEKSSDDGMSSVVPSRQERPIDAEEQATNATPRNQTPAVQHGSVANIAPVIQEPTGDKPSAIEEEPESTEEVVIPAACEQHVTRDRSTNNEETEHLSKIHPHK